LSAPHFGQLLVSGAPQSPQNLLSSGLSLPHFEQRIGLPEDHDDWHLIYHRARPATTGGAARIVFAWKENINFVSGALPFAPDLRLIEFRLSERRHSFTVSPWVKRARRAGPNLNPRRR
jgi:hypothetical protein